ncbi:MAG: diaminopimelate epimerase [Planctomycetes bacterium]|nr:diaminopimelate epimerase [Planctomycetota bacterium]
MRFTKMHGIGNDYVLIDGLRERVRADRPAVVRALCDRRFGVGSDGLLWALPSKKADFRMRMFNPDGGEAQMCGNGIRCLGKYLFDHGHTRKREIAVETRAGTKLLRMEVSGSRRVSRVTVDMGAPDLDRRALPMKGLPGRVVNEPLRVAGKTFRVTCVSMGNPHCVVYVPSLDRFPFEAIAPRFEVHPAFPQRVNTHFVEVLSRREVRQRTWERGAAETWACGTGASAVVVAGVLTGRTDRRILAHLRGGDLDLEWAQDGHVFMTGPATEVYQGEWP